MFDSIRSRHRYIMPVLLFLIATPFVFFGAANYIPFMSSDSSIAKVGSERISQQDLEIAFRERLDQMSQMLGANFDARVFDTPQARAAILDSLLSDRALKQEAERSRVNVSARKLQDAIGSTAAFQQGGQFDYTIYKTLLAARGMTEDSFESRVREDLVRQTLLEGVSDSAVLPKTVADRLWQLQHEKRQIRQLALRPQDYLANVQISEDAVRADYEKNKARYMTPESVKAEYVVLRVEELASQITVPEGEIRAFYDHNPKRWGQAERRRASHILITAGSGASAPDKAQARKLAESVLAKLRSNPADFPRLVKEYSKDPGSASKGGDLGWFGRGMMVQPFEEAVFSMKDGETSGVVESDFGFHIIRVTGVEAARSKPYEDVKEQIQGELRLQAAQKRFSEMAEQFSNFVYEQADALKPAADKFKLQLQVVDGLTRRGQPPGDAAGVFTPAVIGAVFAPDSIEKKRNTKAIEIGANALVSVRVLEHRPQAPIPLEVVKQDIKASLERAAAADLARKAGQARLAELQKTPGDQGFDAPRWIGRDDPQQLPAPALASVMRLSPASLPAFVGVEASDGDYLVVQVLSARPADPPPTTGGTEATQEWLRQLSSADEQGYVRALRQRLGARVVRSDLITSAKDEDKSE